jgi:hypothetical protein
MSPTWWSEYTTPTTTPGGTWGWPATARSKHFLNYLFS